MKSIESNSKRGGFVRKQLAAAVMVALMPAAGWGMTAAELDNKILGQSMPMQAAVAKAGDSQDKGTELKSERFSFEKDAEGRIVNVLDNQGKLFRHYDYADKQSRRPSRATRSSVEPGRQYEVRFREVLTENNGNELIITETGYSGGVKQTRDVAYRYDQSGKLLSAALSNDGSIEQYTFKNPLDSDGIRALTDESEILDKYGYGLPLKMIGRLKRTLEWLKDMDAFNPEAGTVRAATAYDGVSREILDDFSRVITVKAQGKPRWLISYDSTDFITRLESKATGLLVFCEYKDKRTHMSCESESASGGRSKYLEARLKDGRPLYIETPVVTEVMEYDERGYVKRRKTIIHPPGSTRTQVFENVFSSGYAKNPSGYAGDRGIVITRRYSGGLTKQSLYKDKHEQEVSILNEQKGLPATKVYKRDVRRCEGCTSDFWQEGERLEFKGDFDKSTVGLSIDFRKENAGRVDSLVVTELNKRDHSWYGDPVQRESRSFSINDGISEMSSMLSRSTVHHGQKGELEGVSSLTIPSDKQAELGKIWVAERETRFILDNGLESGWTYVSDVNGNRTSTKYKALAKQATSESVRQDSQYDLESNQLVNESYDQAGNMLTWNGWRLSWSGDGDLDAVSRPGLDIQYYYDYNSRLVARKDRRGWTFYDYTSGQMDQIVSDALPYNRYFFYENSRLVLMVDENKDSGRSSVAECREGLSENSKENWFMSMLGLSSKDDSCADGIGRTSPYDFYYVLSNTMNTPYAVVSSQRKTVWSRQFGPFGEEIHQGALGGWKEDDPYMMAAGDKRFDPLVRVNGGYKDPVTGLYYVGGVWYDPAMGRYVAYSLASSLQKNPYLFKNGNPYLNIRMPRPKF